MGERYAKYAPIVNSSPRIHGAVSPKTTNQDPVDVAKRMHPSGTVKRQIDYIRTNQKKNCGTVREEHMLFANGAET